MLSGSVVLQSELVYAAPDIPQRDHIVLPIDTTAVVIAALLGVGIGVLIALLFETTRGGPQSQPTGQNALIVVRNEEGQIVELRDSPVMPVRR